MWGCGFGSFAGMGGWFGGLLFVGLLVLVVFLVLRRGGRPGGGRDREDSLEILKTRLARGEITLDEYDRLKTVLQ